MAQFFTRPWDVQPQEAAELSGDLPRYFDSSVQWGARGLSGGLGFSPSGTISLSATTHGVGAAGNGSNGYTGRTAAESSAAPHLMLCSFVYRESGTNTVAYSFGENASVGAFLQIEVGSGGSVDARWRKANAGNVITFTGPTAVVGRRYDIALHICSDTPSDNLMIVNGVQYSGGGTGGGTPVTYTRETVSALRRDTISNYSKMPVLFTAYGKAKVPAAVDGPLRRAMLEWSKSPLSLFEPRRLYVSDVVSAGGGATSPSATLRAAARLAAGGATATRNVTAPTTTLRAAARFTAGGASGTGAATSPSATLRAAARFAAGGATAVRNATSPASTLRVALRFNAGGAYVPGLGGMIKAKMNLRIGLGI